MTDKQFLALTANMHAQTVFQQQMIGHLFGLVHGLSKAVCVLAKAQGVDEIEVLKAFSSGTREMTRTLAEIPFPEWKMQDDIEPPSATPPSIP